MQGIELLRAEVERTSQTRAAARIGVSPAVVNQVLAGKYKGNLGNVAAKVAEKLGAVECPFLEQTIRALDCRFYRERPPPTNLQQEVRFWRACQECGAWKPTQGGGK